MKEGKQRKTGCFPCKSCGKMTRKNSNADFTKLCKICFDDMSARAATEDSSMVNNQEVKMNKDTVMTKKQREGYMEYYRCLFKEDCERQKAEELIEDRLGVLKKEGKLHIFSAQMKARKNSNTEFARLYEAHFVDVKARASEAETQKENSETNKVRLINRKIRNQLRIVNYKQEESKKILSDMNARLKREKDFRFDLPHKIKKILMKGYEDRNNRQAIALIAADLADLFGDFEEQFESELFLDFIHADYKKEYNEKRRIK